MKYIAENNDIILTEYESFVISQTLECGQCFRFEQVGEENYVVIAFGKILNIYQDGDRIVFKNTSEEDFNNIWVKYFDLDRNYDEIKSRISENDEILKEAVGFAPGIRILNQDVFECLISFIISTQNAIPRIKKIVAKLSMLFGEKVEYNGNDYYTFPTAQKLASLSLEDLEPLKAGYRAAYILDAAKKVASGEVEKGVLVCGTGVGISIAANKVKGIRAVVCSEAYSAEMAVRHNNANIVSFGARVIGPATAESIVDAFFGATYEGERHEKRVQMIIDIENK